MSSLSTTTNQTYRQNTPSFSKVSIVEERAEPVEAVVALKVSADAESVEAVQAPKPPPQAEPVEVVQALKPPPQAEPVEVVQASKSSAKIKPMEALQTSKSSASHFSQLEGYPSAPKKLYLLIGRLARKMDQG